jgi:DNA repair protein RecO (recombination protein O)
VPVILTEGIVTRYVNYRESDRIISIFTIDRGRVDAKARGCRKPTSPLLPVCQPFVYGQFELFSAKDKFTVNQCDIRESFFPIREDYGRFAYGSAILQLCHHAVQENQPNQSLFSLLYHTLSYLAYGESEPEDLFLCFLIRYLNCIGYRPSITACSVCGRDVRGDAVLSFSPERGGTVCAACMPGLRPVSKLALEALRRMLLLEDDQMQKVKLTPALRAELEGRLTEYISFVLEYGAQSLAVLKEDFQGNSRDSAGTKL